MMNDERIQIEIHIKNPNPLFIKWIQEWLNEAEVKKSKTRFNLRDALNSLRKFPLPLATGQDCAILKGFGPVLCQLIDRKLNEYKKCHLEEYNRSINYQSDVQQITQKVKKLTNPVVKPTKIITSPRKPSIKSKSANDIQLNQEQIILNSGKFQIIMLVDTQETNGKSKKILDDTRFYLESKKINYEVRRLSVGDFTWICRDNNNKQNELILPYIVERKRMDDFASSIRDGRCNEQKFRLRDCGIENLIYLIESHGNNQHVGLPMSTLGQAAANTQIQSDFQIKFTDNHNDSMKYLCILTKLLIQNFQDKILLSTRKEDIQPCNVSESKIIGLMKFQTFQESSVKMKKFTVREIFIKQLLQLRNLSIEKAFAITELYPTPKLLVNAYGNCASKKEAEELLGNICYGKLNRPVGMTISKILYQFYCEEF